MLPTATMLTGGLPDAVAGFGVLYGPPPTEPS